MAPAIAGWVARGIIVVGATMILWALYDGVYAEPRRNLVSTRGELDKALHDLGACTARSGEWEAVANHCSTAVNDLRTRCAGVVATASASARSAFNASHAATAPLVDGPSGPVAMNQFFREVYK